MLLLLTMRRLADLYYEVLNLRRCTRHPFSHISSGRCAVLIILILYASSSAFISAQRFDRFLDGNALCHDTISGTCTFWSTFDVEAENPSRPFKAIMPTVMIVQVAFFRDAGSMSQETTTATIEGQPDSVILDTIISRESQRGVSPTAWLESLDRVGQRTSTVTDEEKQ